MNKAIYQENYKNIFSKSELKKEYDLCEKSAKTLRDEIVNSKILALNIVQKTDDFAEFKKLAELADSYKKIIVLGVGGSSLGAKTMCSLKFQSKLEFIESIDPISIENQIKNIDFRNTFFLVISKSGETIETICQTLIIIE